MTRIQRLLTLAAGDALVLFLFAAIGRAFHNLNTADDNALLADLNTAVPFLLAWFVIAPVFHTYDLERYTGPRATAIRTTYIWIAAGVLGLILRSVLISRAPAHWTFIVFTLLFNLAGLLAWRLVFFRVFARQQVREM